ncbi:serine acetyltransferase [Pseudotamlana agarivorans]|uniref:serine acetyltransferase n=1 Tax=Pseudotamlana agarivorans TaxID=481183 RepID=UPI00082AEE2E|nr:serine acetyltransferase [Tamlana agarivorans]
MKILFYIHQTLFIPHYLLFLNHKNKDVIIDDLYALEPREYSSTKIALRLTSTLAQNKYFRTLFYFRTRGLFTNLLRLIYPRDNRLTIDVRTTIAGGVILAHPYSSIINAEKVGKNLYINQLVTIGEKDGKRPVIGNNVKLYTNCTVIGGITIGDNCIIGAGSVVIKDVPANSTVVGNPGRIINKLKD